MLRRLAATISWERVFGDRVLVRECSQLLMGRASASQCPGNVGNRVVKYLTGSFPSGKRIYISRVVMSELSLEVDPSQVHALVRVRSEIWDLWRDRATASTFAETLCDALMQSLCG